MDKISGCSFFYENTFRWVKTLDKNLPHNITCNPLTCLCLRGEVTSISPCQIKMVSIKLIWLSESVILMSLSTSSFAIFLSWCPHTAAKTRLENSNLFHKHLIRLFIKRVKWDFLHQLPFHSWIEMWSDTRL